MYGLRLPLIGLWFVCQPSKGAMESPRNKTGICGELTFSLCWHGDHASLNLRCFEWKCFFCAQLWTDSYWVTSCVSEITSECPIVDSMWFHRMYPVSWFEGICSWHRIWILIEWIRWHTDLSMIRYGYTQIIWQDLTNILWIVNLEILRYRFRASLCLLGGHAHVGLSNGCDLSPN